MTLTWGDLAKEYVQLAAPVLAPVLAAIIATLLLRLVYSNKENARYAGVALALIRANLDGKLQGKAEAVLGAWNSAVKDAMSDKPATRDQALDKFVQSIKSECPLTAQEEQAIRDVASHTIIGADSPAVSASDFSPATGALERVVMIKLGR